jgi:hypothetical protein
MYVFVVRTPVSCRTTFSIGAVVAAVVTTVVVTGIGVGSAVVIGGTVWTVVGIVVGAGVPRFIEQPAIQTDAIRSAATSKMVIFLFIVVTAYFFIQIIVMDSPHAD